MIPLVLYILLQALLTTLRTLGLPVSAFHGWNYRQAIMPPGSYMDSGIQTFVFDTCIAIALVTFSQQFI